MPRARTISHPRSRRIFAPAARSLIPGTVYRSIEKPPPCFRSSSTAAAAISYRAKDVSTMPIRLRPFPGDAGAERRRPLGSPAFRLDRAALGAPAIPPPSSRSCASRRGRPRTARGGRPASPALAGGTPRGSAPLGGNTNGRDGGDRRPPSPLHGPRTPRPDDVLPFQEDEIPLPSICLCMFLREGPSVVRHHLADGRARRESGHDREGRRELRVAAAFREQRLRGV